MFDLFALAASAVAILLGTRAARRIEPLDARAARIAASRIAAYRRHR